MSKDDEVALPPHLNKAERDRLRPLVLVIYILCLVVAGIVLTSCATECFLTVEQDEAMRKLCSPAGCRVMPSPMWREIQQYFRNLDPVNKPAASETS